jgi:type IV pilus assembly protein PilE
MKKSPPSPGGSVIRGFSLIELMVAVAIVAVIAAVAYPSYQSSIRKGKRADAMAAISLVQQAQERWRSNNPSYSTNLGSLGVTEPALYGLTISAPDTSAPASLNTGYVIVAEGREGQANDTQCRRMSVRMVNGNVSYGSCDSCSTFTYASTNPCFSR